MTNLPGERRKPLSDAVSGNSGPLGRVIVTSTPYQEFRRAVSNSESPAQTDTLGRSEAQRLGSSGRPAAESVMGLEHSSSLSPQPVSAESIEVAPSRAAVPRAEPRLSIEPIEQNGPAWLYPKAPAPAF